MNYTHFSILIVLCILLYIIFNSNSLESFTDSKRQLNNMTILNVADTNGTIRVDEIDSNNLTIHINSLEFAGDNDNGEYDPISVTYNDLNFMPTDFVTVNTTRACIGPSSPKDPSDPNLKCLDATDLYNIKHFWPIGSIVAYRGTLDDLNYMSGWYLCDGSTVPGTTIKTPDLSNRFLMGFNGTQQEYESSIKNGDTSTLIGGEKTHILTEDELPEHTHKYAIWEYVRNDGTPLNWNVDVIMDWKSGINPKWGGKCPTGNDNKNTTNTPVDILEERINLLHFHTKCYESALKANSQPYFTGDGLRSQKFKKRVYGKNDWLRKGKIVNINEGDIANDFLNTVQDAAGFNGFTIYEKENDINSGTPPNLQKAHNNMPPYYSLFYIIRIGDSKPTFEDPITTPSVPTTTQKSVPKNDPNTPTPTTTVEIF